MVGAVDRALNCDQSGNILQLVPKTGRYRNVINVKTDSNPSVTNTGAGSSETDVH